MAKGKGKKAKEEAASAAATDVTAVTAPSVTTEATATPTTPGGESDAPSASEGATGTDTGADTGGDTSNALAALLGSDPNASTTEKKSKKGKKGKKKGKKGKKSKKKKKKKGAESTQVIDTGPKYTQQDIDDYIRKRDRERKRRREDRLVNKMKELITIVPSNDIRWTTYTLAPLYQFIRRPDIDIITAFFHKEKIKKEEKKLLFAETSGYDDEDGLDNDSRSKGMASNTENVDSELTTHGSNSSDKPQEKKQDVRKSRGWQRMSLAEGSDGLSLIVLNEVVQNSSVDLFYFLKLRPMLLDKDNFFDNVMFGNVPGGQVAALNALLRYVYTPMFQIPGVLPESIQNEFFSGLTSLMSAMTETHNRLQNQTVLYVPPEATSMPIDKASQDKELCARLENAMIHWIRQIKEVVNTQSFEDLNEWSGPLDEIEFWRARKQDLAGLTEQIQSVAIRTVREIMEIIKSPFVANFNAVTSEILQSYGEAISNLHYLEILAEPCQQLQSSNVEEIPSLIQNLLWLVRVIWLNSPYYNTRIRLNSLLRKISNEIIRHCIDEIDVDTIFNGFIDTSEASIKRCMDCASFWKEKYFEAEKMHHMNSDLTWLLEYDHIFAFADTFLKRLVDLQEVCVCQRLYARRVEGNIEPLPLYPGLKGPEIARIMKEIMRIMDRQLRELYQAQGEIFSLKSTAWNDAMNTFKNSIRDIEMLIQNVLNSTFDTVCQLEQGIQILETFYVYYSRDIIRRTYDQLIMKLYKIVEDDTVIVKNLHASGSLPLPLQYPHFSGRSAWSNFLHNRLDRQQQLLDTAWWLPECGYGEDVKEQLRVVKAQLLQHSKKMYTEWVKSVGNKDHTHRLDIPLMIRSTYKTGMVEVNFDKVLYRHIVEAEMWSRWDQAIPPVLQNVYTERVKLHNLRETVLLVVKDYNRIIGALSFEERSLFKERIKLLGRKVYPGLTRLTWASNVSDGYINECRLAATKVQGFTAHYKHANNKIGKLATKISNILMIKVDQSRLYEKTQFHDYLETHKVKTVLKIAHKYKDITVILRSVFEMFRSDGNDVKIQWIKYLKKIDDVVEEALCVNIQRSLEVLVRVVNGDVRGPPPAIFRLIATIGQKRNLTFTPSIAELEEMICGTFRRICVTFQPFPRVVQFLNDPTTKVHSFSQVMAKNEIARSKQEAIAFGITNTLVELDKYLQSWIQFREVWETDKDVFMRHYEDKNPSVKAYETDIGRYWEVADAVQGFENTAGVGIAIVDCSHLKDIVIGHCHEWQERILNNLYDKASNKLNSIFVYMEDNKKPFRNPPTTLPELVTQYDLFRNVQNDVPRLASEFPRMHEQFSILAKFKYDLGDLTKRRYAALPTEWQKYQLALKEIELMLKQAKEQLRRLFLTIADNFRIRVSELSDDFVRNGPFTPKFTVKVAKSLMAGYRRRMVQLNKDQVDLVSSLAIFEIETAPNQELRNFETELSHLEAIWEIVTEWNAQWTEYKEMKHRFIQQGKDIGDIAKQMMDKFVKLSQTYEKRHWSIADHTKAKLNAILKPLAEAQENPPQAKS